MADLMSFTINRIDYNITVDALAAYVALLTEEYHDKPTMDKARKLVAVQELHDKLKRWGE
jgi:hypothetical protein